MIEAIKLNQQEAEKLLKIIEAHSEPSSQLLSAVEKYRKHLCDTVTIPRDKLEEVLEHIMYVQKILIKERNPETYRLSEAASCLDIYLNHQEPKRFMDQADESIADNNGLLVNRDELISLGTVLRNAQSRTIETNDYSCSEQQHQTAIDQTD